MKPMRVVDRNLYRDRANPSTLVDREEHPRCPRCRQCRPRRFFEYLGGMQVVCCRCWVADMGSEDDD